MNLYNKILTIIENNNIQNFLLNEITTTTEELFFIKKDLTLSRNKNTTKCEVTIFHDFEKDGIQMRGSSCFTADKAMSLHELNEKVITAYTSALSVCNPYYKLPASNEMFTENSTVSVSKTSKTANNFNAFEIADMIFKNDICSDAFINSLELFVTTRQIHIINSNGINVSYEDKTYSGEFVVQCKEPNDVELYQDFKYSSLDDNIEASLTQMLSDNIKRIRDRANAIPACNIPAKNFQYHTIILEGSCVYELFLYYLKRLDASMIYPKYSNFKLHEPVIAVQETFADKINIMLTPKEPFSNEGIRHISAYLIKNNTACYITGNSRFSFYLGIPPIGEYSSFKLTCGNTSLDAMQNEPYLKIVNFSDFQMNELTGQFGGEYRLAYYFDGTNTIPVTNGSISGNINDFVKTVRLSKEEQTSYNFCGPLAVSYKYKSFG